MLYKAWTSDTSFTYDGEYFKLPHDTVVWPKPLQKPHPPIMIVGTSPDTLRIAAERDFAADGQRLRRPGRRAQRRARAAAAARRAPGVPTDTWELGAQTICLVADSNAAAREVDEVRPLAESRRPRPQSPRRHRRPRPATPYDGEADDEGFWDALFYGDPDRVRDKYLRPRARPAPPSPAAG